MKYDALKFCDRLTKALVLVFLIATWLKAFYQVLYDIFCKDKN